MAKSSIRFSRKKKNFMWYQNRLLWRITSHRKFILSEGKWWVCEGWWRNVQKSREVKNVEWNVVKWSDVQWSEVQCRAVKWRKVKWSGVKWIEVRWIEVKSSEVKWSAVPCREVEWRKVKWSEVKWSTAPCSEVKWSEVNWSEVKLSEVKWSNDLGWNGLSLIYICVAVCNFCTVRCVIIICFSLLFCNYSPFVLWYSLDVCFLVLCILCLCIFLLFYT